MTRSRCCNSLTGLARSLREHPDDRLSVEEVAFYDALADDKSALALMGNAKLRVAAAIELVRLSGLIPDAEALVLAYV